MSTFNIKQSFILYKHLAIFTRLCLFVNTHCVYSTQLRGSFYSRMLRQISHLLPSMVTVQVQVMYKCMTSLQWNCKTQSFSVVYTNRKIYVFIGANFWSISDIKTTSQSQNQMIHHDGCLVTVMISGCQQVVVVSYGSSQKAEHSIL
jgi:hypothetical protein